MAEFHVETLEDYFAIFTDEEYVKVCFAQVPDFQNLLIRCDASS